MKISRNKSHLSKSHLSVLVLMMLIFMIMPLTNVSAESKTISFEGLTWSKEIRGRGSASTTDYFPSEQSKVTWSNGNSELTALEGISYYQFHCCSQFTC